MSVSVSMPQLGESVTEGTVTRWLKHEGDHVSADEPLLEVSTDKVDTEIPSPVSGILRGITVNEDETVAVGAELAVIDEDGAGGAGRDSTAGAAADAGAAAAASAEYGSAGQTVADWQTPTHAPPTSYQEAPAAPPPPGYDGGGQPQHHEPAYGSAQPGYASGYGQPQYAAPEPQRDETTQPARPEPQQVAPFQTPPTHGPYEFAEPEPHGYDPAQHPAEPAFQAPALQPQQPPAQQAPPPAQAEEPSAGADGAENAYVTPLVRKLAAEHGIDLAAVAGTGVGGRIRKQDVLEAARAKRGDEAPGFAQTVHEQAPQPAQAGAVEPPPEPAAQAQAQAPAVPAQAGPAPAPAAPAAAPPAPPAPPAPAPAAPAPAAPAPAAARAVQAETGGQPSAVTPSAKRGTTERLSRARQVIAQRMVESLQTSAQLTTVVEADVTAIARLRARAKASFEAREGVKLSFLPFFALATIEALKVHPKLNAVIDTANGTVTYHDAEHLGIAVDTDRGLMVPVVRNAGDLNIGGLARKIADLANRTRAGQVNPDDLSGGTFTLTNTGSRGALFDTPIINQPQVGILGTGTVNKRAVVVDDPDLGEVITVRSIVYLALTYDHRLVDGADAARFLVTVKNRLEEGAFESELGH
jgi:pyruvate dehydrogenase E2 component (dihydrolipoamide acetyltransferase)